MKTLNLEQKVTKTTKALCFLGLLLLISLTTGCAWTRKADLSLEHRKPTVLVEDRTFTLDPKGKPYLAHERIERQPAVLWKDRSTGGALTVAADPDVSAIHAAKTNQTHLGGAHEFNVGRYSVTTTNASKIIDSTGTAVGNTVKAFAKPTP